MDITPAGIEFTDLVKSLLRRHGQLDWLDWLPIAEIAAEAPERWLAAFNEFRTKEQYEFLDLLRGENSGALADVLLITLARYAAEIDDEQVRQFVLEDAKDAHNRDTSRIQRIRDRITPLAEHLERSQRRLGEEFDLIQEINRLEGELANLRIQESGQDERFAQVHAIERDILRMETQRRILADYDEADRKKIRENLKVEVESLSQRQRSIEKEISELIGTRDGIKRSLPKLEEKLRPIETEIQADRKREAELTAVLEDRRREEKQNKEQLQAARVQMDQLEQDLKEARIRLSAEQKKLQELQVQSSDAGFDRLDEIETRIRAVYAVLPDDLSDTALRPSH